MGKIYNASTMLTSIESLLLIQYAAWSKGQRWALLEYILMQLDDEQLLLIQSLLEPSIPPVDQDFSRILPRCLCLRIFSLLDPQSLCRAAQVDSLLSYLGIAVIFPLKIKGVWHFNRNIVCG